MTQTPAYSPQPERPGVLRVWPAAATGALAGCLAALAVVILAPNALGASLSQALEGAAALLLVVGPCAGAFAGALWACRRTPSAGCLGAILGYVTFLAGIAAGMLVSPLAGGNLRERVGFAACAVGAVLVPWVVETVVMVRRAKKADA